MHFTYEAFIQTEITLLEKKKQRFAKEREKNLTRHCMCASFAPKLQISFVHSQQQSASASKESSTRGDPQCRTYCYFDCELPCTFHQLLTATATAMSKGDSKAGLAEKYG